MIKRKELTVEASLKNSKEWFMKALFIYIKFVIDVFKKRSVQHFERNIKNESSNPINVFSFDGCLYFCKTCHKKIAKGKVPCQSASNKLEVYNFPSHFHGIRKLEKVLIAERLLFKKITIMPHEQMEKISGTVCNFPLDTTNVTNMLPRNMLSEN